jgi:glycosyltransferase involved in cell wall biosynthesis
MHFCLIFRTLEMGGMQTLMLRMSDWLEARGHSVTVLSAEDGPVRSMFSARTRVIADGARLDAVARGSTAAARRFLRSELDGQHVDVFFAFAADALWLASAILNAQDRPARCIAGAFGPNEFGIGRVARQRPWLSGLLYPETQLFLHHLPSDCRLYMNRGVEELVTKSLGEHAPGILWPLPVDGTRYLKLDRRPEPGLIVSVGRLATMKEYNLWMIDVIAGLRRAGRDVRWHVYGDGPLRGQMESRIRQRGMEGCITLAGELPYADLPSVLSRAYAFVGMGTAIIEAGFAAVPAVVAPIFRTTPETYGLLSELPDYACGEYIDMPFRPAIDIVDSLLRLSDVEYERVSKAQREHAMRFESERLMVRFLEIVGSSPEFERLWHPSHRYGVAIGIRNAVRGLRRALRG